MSTAASAPELAALSVLDPSGKPVPLSSLWSEKPLVLAFVRHFG